MKRIAIIGGGVAGLSAAYFLEKARQRGADVAYELFEQSARLGGILHTECVGEWVVEAGADSFLTEKAWAADLCHELGLEDELIGSNDEERKTYVLINGKLQALPNGLQFIVPATEQARGWEFFSAESRQQFTRELESKPGAVDGDESVASFVERHFGRELLERVADPMLAGIYGGEAEKLSARAVMPHLVEMEQTCGSLLRALEAESEKHGRQKAPIFTSLKGGMGELAEALEQKLKPASIHLNSKIEGLTRDGSGWLLGTARAERFDGVILAVPAWAAADLLKSGAPKLAPWLAKVRYTPSVTVAFGYSAATLARNRERTPLPEGFGCLIPRSERRRTLACTFVHNKFRHRAPEGADLVRLFFGGARDEQALSLSDDEICALGRAELREITGFDDAPDFWRVCRWPRAMPQYDVGHLELIKEIEQLAAEIPGLALAGNAYHGVGIPDCIRSGSAAAEHLL